MSCGRDTHFDSENMKRPGWIPEQATRISTVELLLPVTPVCLSIHHCMLWKWLQCFCSTRFTPMQEFYTNRWYPVHLCIPENRYTDLLRLFGPLDLKQMAEIQIPPRVLDPTLKILERRCNASQARKVQRQVRTYTIPGVQNTNSGHSPCMTEIAATFCSSYVHTWRQKNDRKKIVSFIFFTYKLGYLIKRGQCRPTPSLVGLVKGIASGWE